VRYFRQSSDTMSCLYSFFLRENFDVELVNLNSSQSLQGLKLTNCVVNQTIGLATLDALTDLDLARNNIQDSDYFIIVVLTKLVHLRLSQNNYTILRNLLNLSFIRIRSFQNSLILDSVYLNL
jgi:hypothetical protein